MSLVANPLDITDIFLKEAIELTYMYVSTEISYIPTIYEISHYLPRHFIQEMAIEVQARDCCGEVGARDYQEFLKMARAGEYDRFVPNDNIIMMYLNRFRFSYMYEKDGKWCIKNDPICEVW